MATTKVNYDDKRLADVKAEEQAALNQNTAAINDRIAESDKAYQDAINNIGVQDENGNWNKGSWADIQTQVQNENTEFAIEQIEQQKDQAHKDYIKEQSASYVDWQQQSGQHGVNAEKMAAQGMTGTGFSESSQVRMYTAYQNRVATARASYDQVVMSYNNAITQARLQNNSALAEIAATALTKGLEFTLQALTHRDNLLSEEADRKLAIQQFYNSKWQDTLNQINTENALAEEQRQYDQNYALEQEKLAEEKRQFDKLHSGNYFAAGNTGISDYKKDQIDKLVEGQADKGMYVNTAYYRGKKNSDCAKFGTFSNGYQPKGISGHGKLTKTGKTVQFTTQTLSGQKQTVVQNIWKAEDGTYWYWEGRQNKYLRANIKGGSSGKF